MKITYPCETKIYDNILYVGDVHGDHNIIPNFLKANQLSNCAIIQLGDFGIGFESEHNENKRMLYLNNRLKVYNSDLYVLSGNHDDPAYFRNEYNQSNLYLLKHYTVLTFNNVINILFIGGATSVDRTTRRGYWDPSKTHDYWKDEVLVVDNEKLAEIKDIDIVCTHTSPDFVFPLSKGGIKHYLHADSELENDLNVERANMTHIFNTLVGNGNKIKSWYYAHFHNSKTDYINYVKFCLVNVNEVVEDNFCNNILNNQYHE